MKEQGEGTPWGRRAKEEAYLRASILVVFFFGWTGVGLEECPRRNSQGNLAHLGSARPTVTKIFVHKIWYSFLRLDI